MGPEAFDAFLKSYYDAHKWDIATGDSFKLIAESHCECDLTPLFEIWVYPQQRPADGM
jgi:aminopeptidase N